LGGDRFRYGCVLELYMAEQKGPMCYDQSGYGNDSTIYGAGRRKGPIIGALEFDGVDDYIQAPDSPSLDIDTAATGGFTISLWLKILSWAQPTYNQILVKGELVSGIGWIVNYSCTIAGPSPPAGVVKGAPTLMWANPDGTVLDHWFNDHPLNLDRWYHVAFTFDRSNIRYFVDGVLRQTIAETVDMITNDKPFTFGGGWFYGGLGTPSNVLLGAFRVYRRALSEKEVLALYSYVVSPTIKVPMRGGL